jgi:hypothetical protein
MWNRWIIAIAIFSGLAAQAKAAEFHHMSCTVVRLYVAKYSAPAAEAWARSQGATEAEIMVARRCLQQFNDSAYGLLFRRAANVDNDKTREATNRRA